MAVYPATPAFVRLLSEPGICWTEYCFQMDMTKKRTLNNVSRILLGISGVVCLVFLLSSCSERYLREEAAARDEVKGAYTLILYGGHSSTDIKTFAILVKESGRYNFDIYAPDFDYTVIKGVDAGEAVKRAEHFVSFHHAFWKDQWRKILDANGEVVAFEVRPLYHSINFGVSDLLDVYYKKAGDKIIVYIRLYQNQQYMPFEGDKGFITVK